MKVVYTAAHSGFDLTRVPLGGGAAVYRHLVDEWQRTKPFTLQVMGPHTVWPHRPPPHLTGFSELAYARFCRRFENACTEKILGEDPRQTIVLINDVSEGPDFRRLAAAGFSLYTIYHVDVVDYFCRLYLHSWVRPETLTRAHARLERLHLARLIPDVFKLVVQKQADSVRYSKGLFVPSAAMREVLRRCYPATDPTKIHVLPWGIWGAPVESADVAQSSLDLQVGLPADAWKLLLLSRISPEKAQDRLLGALQLWERERDYPPEGVVVLLAGEAAYMQGKRFERKLRRMAGALSRTTVRFVGFASGARKQALFEISDLYVFPSKHESYGLTLLEAMRAGLPVLACDDHGTRDVVRPEFGELLPPCSEADIPKELMRALRRLYRDRKHSKEKGARARAFALTQRFDETAARLAAIMIEAAEKDANRTQG